MGIVRSGLNQIISSSDFKNLFVPSNYQEGIISYTNATLSRKGQELESEEGFVETFRDDMKEIDQYAGEHSLYGMVTIVPQQPLEDIIAISDEFKPYYYIHDTWIYYPFYIDGNPKNPIIPEFNMNKTYDDGDVTFAFMLALMQKRDDFTSMVRGVGQLYDNLGRDFKTLKVEGRTQVEDIKDLPNGQRAANPEIAFAIDGLRRAILQAGSNDVPKIPFGGERVRVPTDGEYNGRIDIGDHMNVVPYIGSVWKFPERSKLDGHFGYNDYPHIAGWIAASEL